jgi:UDP-N-acetylglucosamine--N-acetylmuramyl-(pentapeptide) pyrophosphoryl-undecaprenol N-acetylglucosamine transferase
MVNRLLRHWAKKMFVAHAGMLTSWGTRALLVGIPVRDGIEDAKSFKEDFKKSGLNSRPVHILVIGGSQGAYSMNRIVLESLEQLFPRLDAEVILQWGKWPMGWVEVESYLERFKDRLLVLPFIEDMALTYRWADIIVSRSGASTLAELAFVEKPAILVPFPFATHNHQLLNAQAAERAGAARVLEEKHLNANNLVKALVALAQDPACMERMGLAWKGLAHPKAADRMIETIEAYMEGVNLNVPAKPYAVLSRDRRNRDERNCRASLEP